MKGKRCNVNSVCMDVKSKLYVAVMLSTVTYTAKSWGKIRMLNAIWILWKISMYGVGAE